MTKTEILDKLKFDIKSIDNEADKLCNELNFSKKDVRYYFYGMFQSITDEYYLGLNAFFFFECVNPHKIFKQYEEENLTDFKNNHTKELFFSQLDPRDLTSIQNKKIKIERYKHSLKRNLILGSFSSFETCINLIFESICNKDDYNNYVNKIIKVEKKSFLKNFDNNQQTIIIEKLLRDISLQRKYRFLTKDIKNELFKKNRGEDIKFIDFISKYRNCLLHNNGIYNDDKYEREYFGSKFIFEKGKEYRIENVEKTSLTHWKIAFEMKSVFTRLIKNLNHNELIEYPE